MDHRGKYNIKAFCNIVGIQPGTLRVWERRYNIVEPIRNESGHRLYTDQHLSILRWLIDKLDKGFTIGQAVGLLEKGMFTDEAMNNSVNENKMNVLIKELEYGLLNFDEAKANRVLNEAFSLFSIEVVMISIITEVLKRVGNKWESGEITVAHEHYASQYLRTRIGMIFHQIHVDGIMPKIVAVCGPEEKHELGLLIFTLYLRKKGYDVIYLGTGIPKVDIEVVLNQVQPQFLAFSCTLEKNMRGTLSFIQDLSSKFANLKIGVGGQGVDSLNDDSKKIYNDYLIGNHPEKWDNWLKSH